MESNEPISIDDASKKSAEMKPLTFNEVQAIIQSDNSEKLKEIIEEGRISDINMVRDISTRGSSLLMVACKGGSVECARMLLDYNTDVTYRAFNDDSLLKCACLNGNVDMLYLIIECGTIINDIIILELFKSVEIVLNTQIASILVGLIQNVNWEEEGSESYIYIYRASRAGNAAIVQLLLERGALVRLRHCYALDIAAREGHLDVVELFIDWDATTEQIAQGRMRQAVLLASLHGHMSIIQCMIERGISVVALSLALYAAVKGNQVEIATYLLDRGADYNAIGRSNHFSPWMHACKEGYPAMVRLLLDRGADPNTDASGVSPCPTQRHWRYC